MTQIDVSVRPLAAPDLQQVVDLYRESFVGVALRPHGEVERKVAQLFFDGPLCDPGRPSMVACDAGGRVVGFRGTVRRWWRLGEERLHGSTGTAFMVRKELRRQGISMAMRLAWRRLETEGMGMTELGYGDRSTADGRAFGTSDPERRTLQLEQYGFDWMLPLRPRAARLLRGVAWRVPAAGPGRPLRRALLPLLRALPERRPTPAAPPLRSAPLSPAALQEAIEAAGRDRALRIDESLDTWRWLLDYLRDYPSRGRFSGRVFLDERGNPFGFCAGYSNDANGYELLGFAAPLEAEGAALDDVMRAARETRALFVTGTACARQLRLLLERGAEASPGSRVSLRSPRPEVGQHFQGLRALVTGLEGERWL